MKESFKTLIRHGQSMQESLETLVQFEKERIIIPGETLREIGIGFQMQSFGTFTSINHIFCTLQFPQHAQGLTRASSLKALIKTTFSVRPALSLVTSLNLESSTSTSCTTDDRCFCVGSLP